MGVEFLTKWTTLTCAHGGDASPIVRSKQELVVISNRGANAFVLADRLLVLTEEDVHQVLSCPAPVISEGKLPPCDVIIWKGTGHESISINGVPALHAKSKGWCMANHGQSFNGYAKINPVSLLGFEWVDSGGKSSNAPAPEYLKGK